jgi:hypothetical protein
MSSFKKAFKASRAISENSSKDINLATSTATNGSATVTSKSNSSSPGIAVGGVKAWLNGQKLTSTGHRQLDELLGYDTMK